MTPSRAAVALAALLTLLLAACSSTPGAGPADDGGTRTVATARGEVTVPATPRRVVVLEPVQLDTTVALDARRSGPRSCPRAPGCPPTSPTPARG